MRIDLPASGAAKGTVPGVRNPIVLSHTPLVHEHAAPLHAEHTRAVLEEFGYDDAAIQSLASAGVIDLR
jgi:crotonobetainyl-CoA:carnitine CoA-transferase CaiB-like acyl-CoA transferase